MNRKPCAGFVGFGEVNTPREFIDKRVAEVAGQLAKRGIELVMTPPVSDDPAGEQASRAVRELSGQGDFDVLVVCVAGWIPSWAVFRTVEHFRHKPMLLWGLSGWRTGDHFVTTADQAGTTALRNAFAEMGYNFKYLVNFKDSAPRYDEAALYILAAAAFTQMHSALIGMSGYRDMRLYGTLYNGCLLKGKTGAEIEHFDLLEIAGFMKDIPAKEIKKASEHIRKNWKFVREPQPGTVENSVRLALAFKKKIEDRKYAAFSFCDVDGVKKLLHFAPAGAMTLLHDLVKLPSIPENDCYGAVTEVIVQYLTGVVPGYLEFYEFTEKSALIGVPDYIPGSMVKGKITVMPNAFGSFGEGLLNVSKLKTGPVTLLRLGESGGKLLIHACRGEAKTPEKWEEAGWAPPAPQLPSLEVFLEGGSENFLRKVMGQHYIISCGDLLPLIREFCNIAGIELVCGDVR